MTRSKEKVREPLCWTFESACAHLDQSFTLMAPRTPLRYQGAIGSSYRSDIPGWA